METPPPNDKTPNPNDNEGNDSYHITLDELILAANTAINNADHAEIAPLLLKRGYAPADIAAGKTLVDNVQTLDEKQKKEYSEQYQATETYNKDWNELKLMYSEHVELARIAFENDLHNYVQLGLQGRRKESFSGYMQQAKQYYNNALKDQAVMDVLSKKGISKKELEDTLVLIEKVEKEKYAQQKETGEAQQATKVRDAAHDDLGKWFGEFKRVAIVALSSKPVLAKILGF